MKVKNRKIILLLLTLGFCFFGIYKSRLIDPNGIICKIPEGSTTPDFEVVNGVFKLDEINIPTGKTIDKNFIWVELDDKILDQLKEYGTQNYRDYYYIFEVKTIGFDAEGNESQIINPSVKLESGMAINIIGIVIYTLIGVFIIYIVYAILKKYEI